MTTDQLPAFGPPATSVPPGRRLLSRALARPSLPALVGLVVVVVLFGLEAPELLTPHGIAGVVDVAAMVGIGGVPVALLLIAGQFDLSVGVVSVASSLVTALLVQSAGWGIWPALLTSLAGALLIGLVNGLLVVSTGLSGFLVTLATFLVLQGATLAGTQLIADTGDVEGLGDAPGWHSAQLLFDATLRLGDGRFRASLLWWVAVTAVATWVLWRTRFGNGIFASGGARHAARELGVPVRQTTVTLYCLTAVAGWLLGTLVLVRTGGLQASVGPGPEIEFVVVAVIGGCLLTGGYGSAVGAAVGALLYGVVREGIDLAGWDARWFQSFLGGLLLVALLANGVVRRRLKAVPRS